MKTDDTKQDEDNAQTAEGDSVETVVSPEQCLIMHAVSAMFDICGNSYANAYIEEWLILAKNRGGYFGETVGEISELSDSWERWMEENKPFPDCADFLD